MSRKKELNLKTYPIDVLYSVAVENSFNRIKNVVCVISKLVPGYEIVGCFP